MNSRSAGLRPASPATGGRNHAQVPAHGVPPSTHAPAEFNQEFRAYEQVAKLQRYRLAEGAEEEFDEDFVLKPCDLSLLDSPDAADRARFIADLGESLEDTGFAILTGHGVAPALYAEAHRRTREFFETSPARGEAALPRPPAGVGEPGLLPDARDHRSSTRTSWRAGCSADAPSNSARTRAGDEAAFWPSPGWEPFFRQIVEAHERLIHPIMRSILAYLGEDPALFDERLTATNFGFRLNYYPPMTGRLRRRPPAGCSATRTWTSSPSSPPPRPRGFSSCTGRP